MLKVGSTGDDVKELQKALCGQGFVVSKDGKFGPATKQAVADFCEDKGHDFDGGITDEIAEDLGIETSSHYDMFDDCKGSNLRETISEIVDKCLEEEVDKSHELAEGSSDNWGVNFAVNVLNAAYSLHNSRKHIEASTIEEFQSALVSTPYDTNRIRPGDFYVYESQRGKKVIGIVLANTRDTVTGISANSFIDNGEYNDKLVKVYRGVRGKTFYPSRV
jgi:peptidoglycan hydrolase-like protein with peptidoglycan-binding domain